ncbi:unnamed protein product [Chondrus crispus]|uniref:Uncharacterized protein n=1 Tax=Chondrus crispus TaxID=2769 RepID=R7QAM5_CHOCR|nr:unnamed protein product [Chondrus crispus]CDF34853.1 unnamed protein product [Chondrus crispus]|eukprot:XP_005714672.1 unnamed protein product [Chondrus crispus]
MYYTTCTLQSPCPPPSLRLCSPFPPLFCLVRNKIVVSERPNLDRACLAFILTRVYCVVSLCPVVITARVLPQCARPRPAPHQAPPPEQPRFGPLRRLVPASRQVLWRLHLAIPRLVLLFARAHLARLRPPLNSPAALRPVFTLSQVEPPHLLLLRGRGYPFWRRRRLARPARRPIRTELPRCRQVHVLLRGNLRCRWRLGRLRPAPRQTHYAALPLGFVLSRLDFRPDFAAACHEREDARPLCVSDCKRIHEFEFAIDFMGRLKGGRRIAAALLLWLGAVWSSVAEVAPFYRTIFSVLPFLYSRKFGRTLFRNFAFIFFKCTIKSIVLFLSASRRL